MKPEVFTTGTVDHADVFAQYQSTMANLIWAIGYMWGSSKRVNINKADEENYFFTKSVKLSSLYYRYISVDYPDDEGLGIMIACRAIQDEVDEFLKQVYNTGANYKFSVEEGKENKNDTRRKK